MDASFLEAHRKFTDLWEGGASFTQNKKDPGGATKYGVSFRFLKGLPLKEADINLDGVITWQDVQALSRDKAEPIFYTYFWLASGADKLQNAPGVVLYDAAVNMGISRAVKILQFCVGVKADGIIGNKTLGAASVVSPDILARKMILCREIYYRRLADSTDWADDFLKGWINRTSALSEFIGQPVFSC